MKLIDLPITLREAAVKNQLAQGWERDVYDLVDSEKLYWVHTPQGFHFWQHACYGQFSQTLKYLL